MMLLSLSRRGSGFKTLFRQFSSSPSSSSVNGNTIHITFVDQEGTRATVPALVGKTLLEVAQKFKVDLEGPCAGGAGEVQIKKTNAWTEYQYGEGPSCFFCHVKIPSNFSHLLDAQSKEERNGLQSVWEEEYAATTSRLACLITLEKKHDGLIVFVPDAPPTDCV